MKVSHIIIGVTASIIADPAMAQNINMDTAEHTLFLDALEIAKSGRFATAFDILNSVDSEQKQDYQYRFTKARILTWQQSYQKAEAEYIFLSQTYPNNPDVKVSYGFLELFRGNLDKAEAQFDSVLISFPNYTDASEGLERTKAALNNS